MDDDDLIELRALFLDECRENIDLLEAGLMRMGEGEVDADTLNEVFRAAHSIKGGGATFGFVPMSELTHHMETLLDAMRSGRRVVDEAGVDLLLEGLDLVQALLEGASEDPATDHDERASLQSRLEASVGEAGPEGKSTGEGTGAGGADTSSEGGGTSAPAASPRERWSIDFRPHENFFVRGHDPLLLLAELDRLGDCRVSLDTAGLPPLATLEPAKSHLAWRIEIECEQNRDGLAAVFDWVDQDCDVVIEPLEPTPLAAGAPEPAPTPVDAPSPESPSTPSPAPASAGATDLPNAGANVVPLTGAAARTVPKESGGKGGASRAGESASIRIPTEKIDQLIDLVGELVITQSMLSRVAENIGELDVDELRERLADLEHNTRDLQESVMQVRMLPLSSAFSRLPRLVRDLSKKLGKDIELVLEGGETELDKTVLERMIDPLVHLVRNSLDHGLEPPEERLSAGKDPRGQLVLSAKQESGSVNIRISDDGRGIDTARILEKARTQGIVPEDETLSEEQIRQLIFAPGFSTATTVSDVSGRGVGMDVVRRNINDLGGRVRIGSERGAGTSIDISLPLSLAILDGQLVGIAGQTFVVPILAIVETLEVRETEMRRVPGVGVVARFRGEYLPVVDVADAFSLSGTPKRELIVVVETHGQRRGLLVDGVLGQQQVVIKPLERNYKPVTGIAGATIMSDGSVALILDPAAITGEEDALPTAA